MTKVSSPRRSKRRATRSAQPPLIDHRYYPHIIDQIWLFMDHRDLAQARLVSKSWKRRAVERLAAHLELSWQGTLPCAVKVQVKGRNLSDPSVKPTLCEGADLIDSNLLTRTGRAVEDWGRGPHGDLGESYWAHAVSKTRAVDLCAGLSTVPPEELTLWRNLVNSRRCTLRVMATSVPRIRATGETALWVFFLPLASRRLPEIIFLKGDPFCAQPPRRIVINIECNSDPLQPLHPSVGRLLNMLNWRYHLGLPSPDDDKLEVVTVILTRPDGVVYESEPEPTPPRESPPYGHPDRDDSEDDPDGREGSWSPWSGDGDGFDGPALVALALPAAVTGSRIAEPQALLSRYLSLLEGQIERLQIVGLEDFLSPDISAEAYLQDLVALYNPITDLEALSHDAFEASLDAEEHRLFTVK